MNNLSLKEKTRFKSALKIKEGDICIKDDNDDDDKVEMVVKMVVVMMAMLVVMVMVVLEVIKVLMLVAMIFMLCIMGGSSMFSEFIECHTWYYICIYYEYNHFTEYTGE